MNAAPAKFSRSFWETKRRLIDGHPVITNNPFTKNLPKGRTDPSHVLTPAQMQHSALQWLAFSSQFPRIQAAHLVNAPTRAVREAARNILGNELGVPINRRSGSIEGGRFSHAGAHIEWAEDFAEALGVDTTDLNYLRRASDSTKQFIAIFEETYGSSDPIEAAGASYAVELWAGYGLDGDEQANNFWNEEIEGIEIFNEVYRIQNGSKPLDPKFFTYHRDIELGHVANVEDALADIVHFPDFDEDRWLGAGVRALDGVHLFFAGREEHRRQSAKAR